MYNYHLEKTFRLTSADELPEGRIKVELHFIVDDFRTEASTAKIFVNGRPQGEIKITGFIFMMETHVSLKDGVQSAVSDDFVLPFEYPDELENVTVNAASYVVSREELLNDFFAID